MLPPSRANTFFNLINLSSTNAIALIGLLDGSSVIIPNLIQIHHYVLLFPGAFLAVLIIVPVLMSVSSVMNLLMKHPNTDASLLLFILSVIVAVLVVIIFFYSENIPVFLSVGKK
eukprot:15917419-Heterocapsa_arctica.AAC.1